MAGATICMKACVRVLEECGFTVVESDLDSGKSFMERLFK